MVVEEVASPPVAPQPWSSPAQETLHPLTPPAGRQFIGLTRHKVMLPEPATSHATLPGTKPGGRPFNWVTKNAWEVGNASTRLNVTPALAAHQQRSGSFFHDEPFKQVTRSVATTERRSRLHWKGMRWLWGLPIMLLIVAGTLTWIYMKNSTDVTLYQVTTHQTTQYVGGSGLAYPFQQLLLSYPVAERVLAVNVRAGDMVNVNQPLLQLDPTQLDAQIKQAADNVAAAQAYLETVTANGNAVAIAQAQQAYTLAKNKYNALVAQSSSPILHDGSLVSPMHGVVTTVNIHPGEVFSADTPLLTIMDESSMIIHAKIPLEQLGFVYIGQEATVTPSAIENTSFKGNVVAIIPQADPQSDTFEVWVSVTDSQGKLLPGMSTFVRLQYHTAALLVPRLSVLTVSDHSSVFVFRNQHAYLQPVQIVGRNNDMLLVGNGLHGGDMIVLVGLDHLHPGQMVHVRTIETARNNESSHHTMEAAKIASLRFEHPGDGAYV